MIIWQLQWFVPPFRPQTLREAPSNKDGSTQNLFMLVV